MRHLAVLLFLLCGVVKMSAQLNPELSGDTSLWFNRIHKLREVVVAHDKSRYQRKGNPAIDIMRKVIAAKDSCLENAHPFCRYRKYQKLVLAANDVRPDDLQQGFLSHIPGAVDMVEACPYNGRLILPLSLGETVSWHYSRQHPSRQSSRLEADRSCGLGDLFTSGGMLTSTLRDFFSDVDVRQERVRLLQHTLCSPIADGAIAFYRYALVDTVEIGDDRCFHLYFRPGNQLDFGFSGHLYVMADSSWQLRRCELSLPIPTGVNFVEQMLVLQEFSRVGSQGPWMLVADDMVMELKLSRHLQRALVMRHTRMQGHSFRSFPDSLLRRQDIPVAVSRPDAYWYQVRPLPLTRAEERMPYFIRQLDEAPSLRGLRRSLSLLAEKYIGTGGHRHPNLVDIGPLGSLLSANRIDGLRLRLGARTTAQLHPQLFLEGYYAHGLRSHEHYYRGQFIYSFNRKQYHPEEFPIRSVSLLTTRDICPMAERNLPLLTASGALSDKDDISTALKWQQHLRYLRYQRHQLSFCREEQWGLQSRLTLTSERLTALTADFPASASLRTTSLQLSLRMAPGEKLQVGKGGRRLVNRDVPVIGLSHTIGLDGVLGGSGHWNLTELSCFRRFHLNSWGHIDLNGRGAWLWNQVPLLLLPLPPTNLSYVSRPGAFALIGDMELLADRYLMGEMAWDLNGKLLNRLPFISRMRWREYVALRGLWGHLSHLNLTDRLPAGCHPMDSRHPYVEIVGGLHNIFRFLHVEYVRRLSYLDRPHVTRGGVRIRFSAKF